MAERTRPPLSPSRRGRRPRLVIDTSTLLRGIQAFFPPRSKEPAGSDNPARLLLERWVEDRRQPAFDVIYTEDILDEYKEVLNRLKIRSVNIGTLIAAIRRGGIAVQSASIGSVSPDPDDDIFYAAAQAGQADAIVTSNPKHFPGVKGLRILSAEQALDEVRP